MSFHLYLFLAYIGSRHNTQGLWDGQPQAGASSWGTKIVIFVKAVIMDFTDCVSNVQSKVQPSSSASN